MRLRIAGAVVLVVLGLGLLAAIAAPRVTTRAASEPRFSDRFFEDSCEWEDTSDNPYFPLVVGQRLVLAGRTEDGQLQVTIEVTDETRVVDGVTTRVVVETETLDGELVEISRNFFAECDETGSVFYFGEEVDIYERGQIASHDGAWLAGVDGARPGIIMPGTLLLGARYYQEVAPGAALDRAEVLSVSDVLRTRAGTFRDVLRTRESTPLEPDHVDTKRYARGIGLVQDADITLVEAIRGDSDD